MTRRQLLARRRLRWALVLVLSVFLLFGVRLFQIQGFDTSAYAAMAEAAGVRSTVDPAQRGQIVDRNGVELAGTVDSTRLIADPKLTSAQAPQIARVLQDVLGSKVDYFTLIDKLRTPNSRYVYLAKSIPAWLAKDVFTALEKANESRADDEQLVGVFTEKLRTRTYPGGSLAANLLGFVDDQGKGVGGLEQQYENLLHGTDGRSTVEVSPTGQRIPMADADITEMVAGQTLQTTIDRDLQWYADQRLRDAVRSYGANWGLAVTMDVRTCQIVQISQAPTFNADTRAQMNDSTTVARAYQTVYEPGSVLKPVTMAALADLGKIEPDTALSVPGSMVFDGFRIGDYWEHGRINLTAAGVISKSSNLGTILASQRMSDKTFHGYLRKFGFGQQTGVTLPGESRGILRDYATWTNSSHATISFGQGISVTAMQMMRALNTIANDGVMCEPSVVQGVVDSEGHMTKAKQGAPKRVVSVEAARKVTRMMEMVTAKNGTAPAAAIAGYRVAGKTGTAWRVGPTGAYTRGLNLVSFIGFAPADKPRFITYVALDRIGGNAGGGSHAAPVFHDIMSMALERFGITPTGSAAPNIPLTW